jgi:hypothetical protein
MRRWWSRGMKNRRLSNKQRLLWNWRSWLRGRRRIRRRRRKRADVKSGEGGNYEDGERSRRLLIRLLIKLCRRGKRWRRWKRRWWRTQEAQKGKEDEEKERKKTEAVRRKRILLPTWARCPCGRIAEDCSLECRRVVLAAVIWGFYYIYFASGKSMTIEHQYCSEGRAKSSVVSFATQKKYKTKGTDYTYNGNRKWDHNGVVRNWKGRRHCHKQNKENVFLSGIQSLQYVSDA